MSSCTTIPSSLKLFFKLNQFWSTNFITFHKAAVNTKNCWNTWTRFYNSSRYNVYLRSVTTAKGADSETGANHVKDSGGEFALHALQFGRLCLQRWPSTGKMKKEKIQELTNFDMYMLWCTCQRYNLNIYLSPFILLFVQSLNTKLLHIQGNWIPLTLFNFDQKE